MGQDRDAHFEVLCQTMHRTAGRHTFHQKRSISNRRSKRTARKHRVTTKIGQTSPEEFPGGVYRSFPYDSIIGWNIQNFGPLYIPKAGDQLPMSRKNYQLYHKLISWEQKAKVEYKDSTVFLDGKPIKDYCFQKDYYFMAGDKGENSQDSRYWGLLPEEYIVGKAAFIWKSVDPYTGEFRWERFFKAIH